jgi:hypothetical protein
MARKKAESVPIATPPSVDHKSDTTIATSWMLYDHRTVDIDGSTSRATDSGCLRSWIKPIFEQRPEVSINHVQAITFWRFRRLAESRTMHLIMTA